MSKNAPRPNQQILEEASTWFVAFRSEDPGENSRQDFHDWLKRSPEHIRAYLEIASVYADIPAPEDGRTPPELIAEAKSSPDPNVVPLGAHRRWRSPETAGASASGASSPEGPSPFAWRVVLATSVLIFASLGTWVYADRNTYRTGIGEQRAVTMSDGSIVDLNARSKVRIAFRDDRRDVELIEGQALFRVARDHRRPFVVHAGATRVRAVGTQFDVYRKSTGTTVTVVEGRVAVLSRTSATDPAMPEAPSVAPVPATQAASNPPIPPAPTRAPAEVFLIAGEQITVTPTRARKTERPNVAAATAWTQHKLVFDGTPLSEVLEEFSRYTSRRLIVDTPELAELKISGQYTSASPDSLLGFLSLQKGVVITEVDGETHIRRE